MGQSLVLRREDTETSLLSILKGLEIQKTLGAEPVLAALRHFPAQPAQRADFPPSLDPRLVEVLRRKGYEGLYTHQREAFDAVQQGRNITVVTPTASGKTLCYNLPVLDRILKDPDARALYLFPTKALAQDQLAELHGTIEALGADIATFTYDGDTPQDARKSIRARAHVVVTNPDMLHKGILPHHTKWVKLFENLRYVIVDELHSHRGVYGSHVANILRRLHRLCRFYGSDPQFLCSSATIGNPKELAEAVTGREMTLVDRSGAAKGEAASCAGRLTASTCVSRRGRYGACTSDILPCGSSTSTIAFEGTLGKWGRDGPCRSRRAYRPPHAARFDVWCG